MKNKVVTVALLCLGAILVVLSPEGVPFSVLALVVGLVIVVLIGEPRWRG